jgi:hypothetical protein
MIRMCNRAGRCRHARAADEKGRERPDTQEPRHLVAQPHAQAGARDETGGEIRGRFLLSRDERPQDALIAIEGQTIVAGGAVQFAGQDVGFRQRKPGAFADEQRHPGRRIADQHDAPLGPLAARLGMRRERRRLAGWRERSGVSSEVSSAARRSVSVDASQLWGISIPRFQTLVTVLHAGLFPATKPVRFPDKISANRNPGRAQSRLGSFSDIRPLFLAPQRAAMASRIQAAMSCR